MKIKKSDLLNMIQEQNDVIAKLIRQVNCHHKDIIRIEGIVEPEPQLKQLDQSAFDHPYATDRFKYVALNADGQAVFFESKPVISNCLDIWVVHTGSVMPMLKGYNTSNWQNSLIERDTAKELLEVDLSSELTGSELVRAMLERGDRCVMCMVANNEANMFLATRPVVVHGCTDSGFISVAGCYSFAVAVNNQGEPLTAAEAGL